MSDNKDTSVVPVAAPVRAPVAAKPVSRGWLEDIGYFDNASEQKMRVLAYGDMKVGKTTLLATFPNVVMIDTDKGGATLRKQHIPFVPCYDSKGIIKRVFSILEAARARSGPFAPGGEFAACETIALDSMSVFSNSALVDLIYQTGRDAMEVKAGYDEYGRLLNVQVALGKLFKALSTQYNVVVTALSTVDKDENTGSMVGGPLVVGSYRGLIGADFDEIYYLSSEGTKDAVKHVMFTSKSSFYNAGTRLGGMPYKIESPTYAKIKAFV